MRGKRLTFWNAFPTQHITHFIDSITNCVMQK